MTDINNLNGTDATNGSTQGETANAQSKPEEPKIEIQAGAINPDSQIKDLKRIHAHYLFAIIAVIVAVTVMYAAYSVYQNAHISSVHNVTSTITQTNTSTSNIDAYIYCVGSRAYTPNNLSYYAPIYTNGSVGNWLKTTNYPYFGYGLDCFSNAGYVYCLPAGQANNTENKNLNLAYYAKLSRNGIGNWSETTNYPIPLSGALCYPYKNRVYCVGDESSVAKNQVYYANLSANGIGNWIQTTSYPIPFYAARCVAYDNYMYCIGDGYHNSSISSESYYMRQVRFARILPNGSIGNWTETTDYPLPLSGSGCLPYGGYIYCIGPAVNKLATDTYYAKILPNGSIGNWAKSVNYPIGFFGSICTENNGFMYCIGDGETVFVNGTISKSYFPYANQSYYAKMTTNGFVNWTSITKYPIPFAYSSCVVNNI